MHNATERRVQRDIPQEQYSQSLRRRSTRGLQHCLSDGREPSRQPVYLSVCTYHVRFVTKIDACMVTHLQGVCNLFRVNRSSLFVYGCQ